MPSDVFLRISDNKKAIILGAAQEEFNKYGFENAKVTRICERANLKRVTFYSYFNSIYDIYNYIYENKEIDCKAIFNSESIIKSLTENNFDEEKFLNFEKYFKSMLSSEEGLKKLYETIDGNSFEDKMLLHIFLSLFKQYNLKLISLNEMIENIKKVSTYFES